jgi:hypothetical protein
VDKPSADVVTVQIDRANVGMAYGEPAARLATAVW